MWCIMLIILLCFTFKYESTTLRQVNQNANVLYRSHNYRHCECGRKNFNFSPRIIGGQEVRENEFPWMAGIISISRSRLICGASIINDHYVITAAHCIPYGFGKNDLKVYIGAHNACKWGTRSTIFSVEDIFPHPRYNRNTNFADIMLIKLVMRITFNEFVKPICLPEIGLDIFSKFRKKSVSALGWGFSENDSLTYKDCSLRIVDLTLFNRSECPSNVKSLICAGHMTSSRGTCQGDSGGPLQIVDENYKYILIGITSHGISCANVNYPDFYTDVTQMVSWILQTTKYDSKYCLN